MANGLNIDKKIAVIVRAAIMQEYRANAEA